jgi:hypothetical protein
VTDLRSRTPLTEARDRHRARSRTRQTLAIAGGWLAGAAGVLLVLPAPELGLPLLLLGLRLLAVEHDWAARLYAPVSRVWLRMRSLPRTAKLAVGLGALALVITIVWWGLG